MLPTQSGSFRLFKLFGVNVHVHWSWFLVATYEISSRVGKYSSPVWNVLEYLALFLIVLLHEFGHSLACKQVGGKADQIILWPMGGVAFVAPPERPGANLWSIAAGPLVNVVILLLFIPLAMVDRSQGWGEIYPDFHALLRAVQIINFYLLLFNLLPIYPLDGGQIFRSLLWFVIGRARSLMVACMVGFIGVAAVLAFAVFEKSIWLGLMAFFIGSNCVNGFKYAQILSKMAKLPRRSGFKCPDCTTSPPQGKFWKCAQCQEAFDTFETGAVCPKCGAQYSVTRCFDCGSQHPMVEWKDSPGSSPSI